MYRVNYIALMSILFASNIASVLDRVRVVMISTSLRFIGLRLSVFAS